MVRYGGLRCGAVWRGMDLLIHLTGLGLVRSGMLWRGVATRGAASRGLARSGLVWQRYGFVEGFNEAWRAKVRSGTARCGGQWHGEVGYGMARYCIMNKSDGALPDGVVEETERGL